MKVLSKTERGMLQRNAALAGFREKKSLETKTGPREGEVRGGRNRPEGRRNFDEKQKQVGGGQFSSTKTALRLFSGQKRLRHLVSRGKNGNWIR